MANGFVGNWKDLKWEAEPKTPRLKSLVESNRIVTISPDPKDPAAYNFQWTDPPSATSRTPEQIGTITSPLTESTSGELTVGSAQITIAPLTLEQATAKLTGTQLTVTVTVKAQGDGRFGDTDTGTFTAEADPPLPTEEERPAHRKSHGWRRWLRRLLRRLDELLAEA